MSQKFEKRLLMQAEGLQRLVTLYNVCLDELAEILGEYADYLDDDLVRALRVNEYILALTLESDVDFNDKKIPGIVKQLDDCMDEIEATQAGKPTKHGVAEEDCDDD